MRQPAVFLDRDGVLCRALVRDGKGYAPRTLGDFRLVPNAARSVAELRAAGFRVVVVTNQPDIGNGLVSPALVDKMHERLQERVPVDAILMCPHKQSAGCDCRKPRPGMIHEAAERFGIDLERSFMVGDRASDIEAGRSAGCRVVFIDRGYAEAGPPAVDARVRSLRSATSFILSCSEPSI